MFWRMTVLSICLSAPAAAWAGALEEAKVMVEDGRKLMTKAAKQRAKKKGPAYAEGLKKYARAYVLITNKKLQNDAPDLLTEIGEQIAKGNREPEVVEMRQALIAGAIDASVAGEMEKAYDALSKLRDLDPREWTVEYALGVINERME
jgi:hypothetical protein